MTGAADETVVPARANSSGRMWGGREIVLLGLGLAAVAVLCWWFGLKDVATALRHLNPALLLVYLGVSAIVLVAYSQRWRFVARTVGSDVPLRRFVAARLAGDAVGLLLPSARLAGDPVRVAIVHAGGAPGSRAGAGVTIDRLLEVTNGTVCAVVYAGVFSLTHTIGGWHRSPLTLILVLVVLLASLMVPLVMLRAGIRPLWPLYTQVARRGLRRWSGWIDVLHRTESHLIDFFRERPATFVWGLLASLVIEALVIVQYHFLLVSFGVHIDVPTLLMTLLVSGFAHAAPTPGGLGALEASEVTLLAVAGGGAPVGFVIGVVLRFHELLWMAVGLVVLSVEGLSLTRLGSLRTGQRMGA